MAANFKPCPECGGERIEVNVKAGGSYVLLTQRVGIFPRNSRLLGSVCINCGYTSLYAENPKNLIDKRPDKPID